MQRWSKNDTESLIKLRELLSNDDNIDNITLLKNQQQFPELVGDRRLLRYIRAAKYDINEAKKNYLETLRFRVQNNVNAIRNDIVFFGKDCPNKFPNGIKILSYFKTIILSANHRDIDGNPLSYEDFSQSPSTLIANVTKEEYVIFMIYCLEYKSLILEQLSEEIERNTITNRLNKTDSNESPYGTILFNTFLRNFKGIGWDHITNGMTIVGWVLDIAQKNYPEILGQSHMCNTPLIFEIIWGLIKPFLDSQTLNKVKFYGTDFQSALLSRIEVKNFPSDFDINGTLNIDVNNTPFIFDISPNGPLYYVGQPEQMNTNNINSNSLSSNKSTININRIDSDCYLPSKNNDNIITNELNGLSIHNAAICNNDNNNSNNTSIFGNSIFPTFKRNKINKQHGLHSTDSTSSSDSYESSDYINDDDDNDDNLSDVMDNNNDNDNNDNNDNNNNRSNRNYGNNNGLITRIKDMYVQFINYDFVSDFLLAFVVLAESIVLTFSGNFFCTSVGRKEILLKSPKTWILYFILVLFGKLDYYASLTFRLCDHLKSGVLKVINCVWTFTYCRRMRTP